MAQFARPDSNVTQTSFTNGFAAIDEATASDADFAYGANNTAAELEVGLTNVTDPASSTGHVFRYRVAKTNAGTVDGTGNAVTVTARLMQGTTQIATDTAKTATGTWTQYEYTLSAAEADAITDYTDLRLEFVTSASGGSPANRRGGAVSWAELEVPNAAVNTTVTPGTASLTTTRFAPTVSVSNNHLVTPSTASLTVTRFAPTVSTPQTVTPGVAGLSLTTFAPSIGVGVQAVPSTRALTLAAFAPAVTATDHKLVTPGVRALSTSTFAPTVTATANQTVTPGPLGLSLTGYAPTVTAWGAAVLGGGRKARRRNRLAARMPLPDDEAEDLLFL